MVIDTHGYDIPNLLMSPTAGAIAQQNVRCPFSPDAVLFVDSPDEGDTPVYQSFTMLGMNTYSDDW